MKKNNVMILVVAYLGIFTACSNKGGSDQVLFDESTPYEAVSSPYETSFEKRGDILWVENNRDKEYSGVVIKGFWDLSGCNELIVELVNFSENTFPVYVRMESPGITEKSNKGNYIEQFNAERGTMQKLRVEIPARLPHPEIEDKLFGMKATPYQAAKGYYQPRRYRLTFNPEKVTEISIFAVSRGVDTQWGVKRITAKAGEPEKLAEWINLPEEKFFPFIDKYGQFIHKDWPGKVNTDYDLKESLIQETEDIKAYPGATGYDKYGGWKEGPKQKATGNFYVKKIGRKWWLVDPEGYLFWSHGVVRVTPSSAVTPLDDREFYFKDLPLESSPFAKFYTTHNELLYPFYVAWGIKKTYDFSAANIFQKYGANWRKEFAEMAHKRLKSWGLNTIANSSDRSIYLMDKTPYCERIEIYSPDLEGSKKVWKKFKDPFHPGFCANLREQLKEREVELNDPYCIGFFVDNEYNWGSETSLAEWTLQSPAFQPAKVEFVNNLKNKYNKIENLNKVWDATYKSWDSLLETVAQPPTGSREDCIEFSRAVIEAYFKNIRDVFKKVAPEKLYMGCRFSGSNKTVLQIASEYCDVVSFNIYRYSLSEWSLPEGIDKPVIVGEFHFGALDRGLFHYSIKPTINQEERGRAYKLYVESALRHPNIIGTHWHQFSDQPTTGRFDGENYQNGLTDVCDNPYPETIEKIREVGYNMYNIRSQK